MIRFFELNNEGIIAGRDFLSMMVNRKEVFVPNTKNLHESLGCGNPAAQGFLRCSRHGALNRAGCSCSIDRWPPNASSCKYEMRLAAYRTKKTCRTAGLFCGKSVIFTFQIQSDVNYHSARQRKESNFLLPL